MDKRKADTALIAFACLVTLYALVTLLMPQPEKSAPEANVTTELEAAATTDTDVVRDADREFFVTTWAERIDAFNDGYPLAGYGRTFAEAAYDYGVDPRLSPAIARVESGSGEDCFLPHNAWGWGDSSWSDWDSAIRGHVAGLADGYGYGLTYEMAQVYNQVNVDEWYSWVASCMHEIWESDSL